MTKRHTDELRQETARILDYRRRMKVRFNRLYKVCMAMSLVFSVISTCLNVTEVSIYIVGSIAIVEITLNRMSILFEGLYRHFSGISEAHMLLYSRIDTADNNSNAPEIRSEAFELLFNHSSFDEIQTNSEPL
jgi:hypothetical protein